MKYSFNRRGHLVYKKRGVYRKIYIKYMNGYQKKGGIKIKTYKIYGYGIKNTGYIVEKVKYIIIIVPKSLISIDKMYQE
jgi:hypothetical protein